MKNARFISLFFLITLMAACASTEQYAPFPDQGKMVEDPSKGRIYVMRPTLFGCAISMDVLDGGSKIGKTGPGGYLCWEREPGSTIITGKAENTASLSIDVKPGSVTYIHQGVRMGIVYARNVLELMGEAKGQGELADCDPPRGCSLQANPVASPETKQEAGPE